MEFYALQGEIIDRPADRATKAKALASARGIGKALQHSAHRTLIRKTEKGRELLDEIDAMVEDLREATDPDSDVVRDAIALGQCRCSDIVTLITTGDVRPKL